METVLFRIVQEALTNVIRHSQASAVDVRLAQEDGTLVLRVADNGRGFDAVALAQGKGFGLRGMQERVHILGGELQVQTEPGTGTVIQVRVPMPEEEISDDKNPSAAG
jgi:signal transduction histidine kinase